MSRRARLFGGLLWALALLAVAAGALAVVSLRDSAHADDAAVRAAVLAAARQETLYLFGVGYSTFDRDTQRVLDGATGDFRDQFKARLADYRSTLAAGKWQMKGDVLEAGVASLDGDNARVLVAADQTVTGGTAASNRLSNYRLALTMVRRDGRWLVSTLQMGD